MDRQSLSGCPTCSQKKDECCSAIDQLQDGNEGLLVPDHVSESVFATRLFRSSSVSGPETNIPLMTPEGPSRSTSRASSRATSPHARRLAAGLSVTKIRTDESTKISAALRNLNITRRDETTG